MKRGKDELMEVFDEEGGEERGLCRGRIGERSRH